MAVSRAAGRLHRRIAITFAIVASAGCATIGVVPACAASANATAESLAEPVREAAQRFGIPERWIRAVIRVESGGDPRAVSTAGAMGVMQIMPATWDELAQRYGLGGDPFDARANILVGTAYLRALLDRYGDLTVALAAYNAGPARVDAWHAGRAGLPSETVAYVARIAPSTMVAAGVAGMPIAPVAPDWRSAALFSVDAANGLRPSPIVRRDDDRGAVPMPTGGILRVVTPPSSGLFVALSGHGS